MATAMVFLIFGIVAGAWTSRIPSIKAGLGLTDSQLSVALVAFAVGSITGMVVLGRFVDRVGSGTVMTVLVAAQGLFLILPAVASTPWLLCVALFILGSAQGTLNVSMNANAVEVQRAWGSPIMSTFHAIFSLGGFLGAAIGGVFAGLGLSPFTTFAIVCCGSLAVCVVAAFWKLRAISPPGSPEASPVDPTNTVPAKGSLVVLLGVLAMFAMVAEGAAGDWSAVYLHSTLGTSTAFAATAFVGFSIAMMLARLVGDRIVARIGPMLLVRWSAVFAALVFGIGALIIGTPVTAIIGFAGLGAGLAGITPQLYSFAGQLTSAGAGRQLSIIVGMGYAGFLIGPAVIGFASTLTGLRGALAIPTLFVLVVAIAAGALKPPRVTPRM
jgi:fucose permease